MLDIKFIIENTEVVKDGLLKKGYTKEDIDIDNLIKENKCNFSYFGGFGNYNEFYIKRGFL